MSSLRKFAANGSLRQDSLAIVNAMAWCTFVEPFPVFFVLSDLKQDRKDREGIIFAIMSCQQVENPEAPLRQYLIKDIESK